MHATDVIGFTADADYWCSSCATEAYGPDVDGRRDSEGNEVHPIFGSDETPAGASCNRCHAEITEPCDCSEEFGPCELHCTILAQREGSSSRSADELCVVFLEDAQEIDAECLAPYGRDVLERAQAALAAAGPFSHWFEDESLGEELRDVVRQVETRIDAWTVWDDGYRIVKPSDDCPLLQS